MTTIATETARLVRIADLRGCVVAALERLDLPAGDAALIADVLMDADLRGHDDHGVAFLGMLLRFYRSGAYNPRPNIRVVRETGGALVLDGDHGCGIISGVQAMRWCIMHACERGGMACAAVRHSGHAVAAAPFVEMATEAGLIGFACTTSGPLLAPPGGTTRTLSTNPFAYGFPGGQHPSLILDMASSTVSALKLTAMGEVVPEGLIADADGRPTTSRAAFWQDGRPPHGMMQPLGYPHAPYKGFGLAQVVDALAGVLSGGTFARSVDVPGADVGQFFWALDVEALMPLDEFRARMDEQAAQITGGARLEGVEALHTPGERGQRRRAALLAGGTLPLGERVWGVLGQVCAAVDVPLPDPIAG